MCGNFVFVDEAHFISEECIQNGPLAMLAQHAYIVMACTPPRGRSGIQKILDGKLADGKLVCKRVDYEFTCPTCKKIQSESESYMCPHRAHWRPPQQTLERILIVKACFGDAEEAFGAEMNSIESKGGNLFISEGAVADLRVKPHESVFHEPHFVFVTMDPNGSSKKIANSGTSDYAVVISFVQDRRIVVTKIYICNYFVCIFIISTCMACYSSSSSSGCG